MIWHLLYTKPKKEQVAVDNLRRQGFECVLPMVDVAKVSRGQRRVVTEPLFSRYVFIRLCKASQNWSPIRSTIGVSHLVRFGHQVAQVPAEFVAYCQNQSSVAPRCLVQQLEAGDAVHITSGSFAGYEAVFEQDKGADRAIVLLNIANSFTKLQVDQSILEKVA